MGQIAVSPLPAQGPLELIAPNYVQAPQVAAQLTFQSGGSLGATIYYVKYSFLTSLGETQTSPESSLSVAANDELIVDSPGAPQLPAGVTCTQYKVYVSNTAGGGSGAETLQATVNIGTNWTEPGTGLVAGAAMPKTNATYTGMYVRSIGGGASFPVNQKFHTNAASGVAQDLAMALHSARFANGGNNSGGFGPGLAIDPTVDNAVSDFVTANNT